MRRHSVVILMTALVTLPAPASQAVQPCRDVPLLVHNVDVWTSRGLLLDRDVLIRDGRVAAIRAAAARPPQDLRTIDGTGHTLLPGLVDAHLHFTMPGGLPANAGPRTDMQEISARELIRSGVTSGRLHLASLDEAVRLQRLARDACHAIPRLQVGGPGLSGSLEKDFNSFQGARTVSDAVAKVERLAAAGVDWLAIHDAHRFPEGVLGAIAGAARNARIRLMASGSGREEVLAALSIAPDTLDYIDRTAAREYDADVIAAIRRQRDLVIVPTMGVAFRVAEFTANRARLDDPAHFGGLSDDDRRFLIEVGKKDLVSTAAQEALQYGPTLPAKLRQLRQTGVPTAIGSDAGSMLHWQPNAIWWEMEAWRAGGMSHREVLAAATEGGARVLRETDIGHLSLGAHADFVLYRGNVEDGPFDRARVLAVAKGGVLFVGDVR